MRFSNLIAFKVALPALFLASIFSVGLPLAAELERLPPQTKIRVTIVQWNATGGAYERWDALGGDYDVGPDQSVALPVLGKMSVDGADATKLSADIASALQAKLGLVQQPEVTVLIVAYPPIYVVGDVKSPGEYKFSPGLTVLQSLAMGGGELVDDQSSSSEAAALAIELHGLEDSILRSEITIARLQAEMSGASAIVYPVRNEPSNEMARAILRQEQAIFSARANHIERQSKSFDELRQFFAEEMANLEAKTRGSEEDIKSLQEELRRMKPLVAKGLVVPAVRNELERTIRSATGDRLDLATAIMRARQGIAEASRSIEALHDTQLTEVASELQAEQSALFQLKLKRENAQQKLLNTLSHGANTAKPGSLEYSVSRSVDGKVIEIVAAEDTRLKPGDVVTVKRVKMAETGVDPSMVSGQTSQ